MSFPAYGSYKDSGVEWLGQVPSHWDTIQLRHLVDCCDGARVPLNAEQRADRKGAIPYWGANSIVDYVDAALFDEELVLLGEDGAPFFDRTKPVAFRSIGPIWPNNHVHVLRPLHGGSACYLAYALNSTDYVPFIDGSTRDKLTQSSMAGIPIAWPSQNERDAIAAFLDRETAKIDALVEAQRRLIELLKEKRQAVISHAVTKGLDRSARMKDSGVEWLGQVPAHWEVRPLRHGINWIESGTSVNAADTPAGEGEIGVLKTSCVYRGFFEPAENKVVVVDELDRVSCSVKAGTLIVSRMNTPELVGAAGLVLVDQPNIYLPDRLWQVHLTGLSPAFAYFWTLSTSYRGQVKVAAGGTSASMQNLGQDQFRGLMLAWPPVEEQDAIVQHLQLELAKTGTLERTASETITLLQERRAALISAAVTGKIDVRGLVETAEAA